MAIYELDGVRAQDAYDVKGNRLSNIYDIGGNEVHNVAKNNIAYNAAHSSRHVYAGGYIEIQPDSWDGQTAVNGDTVQPFDTTAWGFPMSLSDNTKRLIKSDILRGDGFGISFIRFPMGFAYRGYRNVDAVSGLAKNIGQRWDGQNRQLHDWFSNIVKSGGGLSVEYWCPAPHWLTGGAYYNPSVNNELWAGGEYPRTTTLESIKATDPVQYAKQIDDFTDAVLNDLEYVHQNIAPVRLYTLATEPTGSGKLLYGHCHWTSNVYNDVFESLHPKVMASSILSTYESKENIVLMHLCADDRGFEIGSEMLNSHPSWIWGYSHDVMRQPSGENGIGADQIKELTWPAGSSPNWRNVFICEYEYFTVGSKPDTFRFANNVVRMLLELWYRKAKILMPVIHICKPTGQTSAQTNTSGYCLFAVDMSDGSVVKNKWSYNSWKMFSDNLPIGAEIVDGGDGGLDNVGYVVAMKDNKTVVLLGNYSDQTKTVTITFDSSKSFDAKIYTLFHVGGKLKPVSGTSITYDVPPYAGIVWIEK